MSSTPIADHALLSDCHSAALVSREGSVEWLCFPRFDSPSVFGRLLDDEAGHWSIRPAADFRVTRRYLNKTMVLETTFATAAGAFTQYFGSDDLDASNLMMPIVGFLPATDPRVLATIDAIADRLTDERGLVYRYDTRGGADGLEGKEGTFVLCTFWLAQALALAGQPARARHVFERAITYLNDVGLLAEEVDPATGELLGNFPQAFSHIGLINAAWAISEAERRQAASLGGLPAPSGLSASAVRFRARSCCLSARPARGHACYVVPVRSHLWPQVGELPHPRAADRIDRWHCHRFDGRSQRPPVVDDIADCAEAGGDPHDAALGEA